jgi:Tol biopolymer transport system component
MTQITQYGRAQERATQPTWTPDGQRIIFTLVGQNPKFDLPRRAATINPDGTNLTVLIDGATHPRLQPTAT